MKPIKGFEVDTCCRLPAFSRDSPFGYKTESHTSSIDPTLNRPYTFSTDVKPEPIERSVPISSYTSTLCASSHSTSIKVGENTTNCYMQPVWIPHASDGMHDLFHSRKIRKTDNWEPLDTTKSNSLVCKTNGSPRAAQTNWDRSSCSAESMPSEILHSPSVISSSSGTDNTTTTTTIDIDKSRPEPNKLSEKAFVCEVNGCNRSYRRLDDLKRHQRIHSDVRRFCCRTCDKKFTRSDHLRTHERTHTGDRPYKCPHCERCFARSDERARHAKVHFRVKNTCRPKAKGVEVVTVPNVNLADYSSDDMKLILLLFAMLLYLIDARRKPEQK